MGLENIKIARRMILVLGLVLATFALVVATSYRSGQHLFTQTENLYRHPFTVSNAALQVRGDILAIHRNIKDVAASTTPAAEGVDAEANRTFRQRKIREIAVLETRIMANFKVMERRFLGNMEWVERAKQAFLDWHPIRQEVIDLTRQNRMAEAYGITRGKGARHVAMLTERVDSLIAYAQNKSDQFMENARHDRNSLVIDTSIIFLGATILALGASVALTNSVTGPLYKLRETMLSITQGNLDDEVPHTARQDEIGDMARGIQQFKTTTRQKLVSDAARREAEIRAQQADEARRRQERESMEQAMAELEQRVADRTHELARSNAALQAEVERRREVEGNLRIAADQALAANKAKSSFLANMSHELRTPLNSVIGYSELIKMKREGESDTANGKDDISEYANNILLGGHLLLETVNAILDLSKIESGRMPLSLETFDLDTCIEEMIDLCKPAAQRRSIELGAVFQLTGSAQILADALLFKRLMLNLINNAIKFSHDGDRVQVTLSDYETGFAIAVSDTGIGMDPEAVPRAMQPFVQLEDTLERRHEGTGLGLPLCRHIAEMHGGAMRIDTAQNEGTTVTIHLPRQATCGETDENGEIPAGPAVSTSNQSLSRSEDFTRAIGF